MKRERKSEWDWKGSSVEEESRVKKESGKENKGKWL